MATVSQDANQIRQMIHQAILDRDILIATYHGHVREMCPHVLGKKNGIAQALFYQFGGGSSSGLRFKGSRDNWRCLRVDELSNVSVRKSEGKWYSASNYSMMQACVDEIEVKVDLK